MSLARIIGIHVLKNSQVGTRYAAAQIGDDGTAQLALYERDDTGWAMIGEGYGEPHVTSVQLVENYDDVMCVWKPETPGGTT